MNTLVLMYVYFDSHGDIKAIAPDPVAELVDTYKMITVPLLEVEPFLLSKKNTFDYYVKEVVRVTDVTYKITRKEVLEVNRLRFTNSFLSEIPTYSRSKDANILIENCVSEKAIRITLNPYIKSLILDGTDDEKESVINMANTTSSSLFFTKKHDPYFLLHTMNFSPSILFNAEMLQLPYTGELSDTSVFTKKLIDGYSYLIK